MIDLYDTLHEWLLQEVFLPILYTFDAMTYADDLNAGVDWLLLGILQILIIAFMLRPLEAKEPLNQEQLIQAKGSMSADVIYSLIHRLGVFELLLFLVLTPLFIDMGSVLHDLQFQRLTIENIFPGISAFPFLIFLIYLVVLDLADYGYHRLSHRIHWWWQLHALHHSQAYMTAWSDNRNHFIDDIFRALVFSSIALLIGIEPSQFVLLVAVSHLIQSWQHGYFPKTFDFLKYLIVTPNFHRYHHALRLGYEVPSKPGVLGGCNFGVLFPWWDLLFKTAIFDNSYHPCGVDHLKPSHHLLKQQSQFLAQTLTELRKLLTTRIS